MKVLIVDDNADDRRILRYNFEHQGCVVLEASDGQEGCAAARLHTPDLIISDALMPRMDGFQFLRSIRMDKDLQHIPFIFYSSVYTGYKEAELAISVGADAFIIKPKEPEELWGEIQDILEERKLRKDDVLTAELIEEEEEYLRRYSAVVATKIEEKVAELERLISARRETEQELHYSLRFLEAVHRHKEMAPLLKEFVSVIKEYTGCDSVGIRVLDEEGGIPYLAYEGFSPKFLETESPLSVETDRCMCINVITGAVDAGQSFYTKKGSFYVNGSSRFLSTISEEVKGRTRNTCNREGYESVALVPFRKDDRILGLIHVADRRENMVPLRKVEMLEKSAMQLGTALQRAQAEESLHESERRYKSVVETTIDGIYQSDADGVFRFVNQAGAEMFGCKSPADMIGRQVSDYWADPKEREAFLEQLKIRKMLKAYSAKGKKRDGAVIHLEISSHVLEDEQGRFMGVEGVLRDVTEKVELETQLRHVQKMEAIGQLAGGIAHDFNNILNVIVGFGSLAKDKLEAGHPSTAHLSEVLRAAEKATTLTQRLLAFSRKQPIDLKLAHINDIVAGVEKMLAQIIGEDIDLTTHLSAGEMPAMVDVGQIEQVLINLSTNARDSMPKGGRLMISTELMELDKGFVEACGYGKPGKYALISMADTGIGMDAETQGKIFEPFFTTKEVGKGTGLGLSIAYGIIKQHNGYLTVSSDVGKGTTFKILLPLLEGDAAREQEAEASTPVRGGTETVLVAEDDAALRKLFRIILESFGYRVITAENGEDAITKFMENRDRIQLLIFDMIMPKKSGGEAYEEIRKTTPGVKVLFASGYTADIVNQEEMLEKGIDAVYKPLSPKDLLKKVREVLDR